MCITVSVKSGNRLLDKRAILGFDETSKLYESIILMLCLRIDPLCGVGYDDVKERRSSAQKMSHTKCYCIEKIKNVNLHLNIDEAYHIIDIGENATQKIEESAKKVLADVYQATVSAKAKEGRRDTPMDTVNAAFMPNSQK